MTRCEFVKELDAWVKLEYENPTGSHKDRGLSHQIKRYIDQGKREFVLSSSGNAGISASYYCQKMGGKLTLFLSPHMSQEKKDRLSKFSGKNTKIIYDDRPLKSSVQFAYKTDAVHLRGSIDDNAVVGFKQIARELKEQLPGCTDIFIPTSSGTTACGVIMGYNDLDVDAPRVHVVQTEYVNKLVEGGQKKEGKSVAEAIVDTVGHRKKQLLSLQKENGGRGWIIPDELIISKTKLLHKLGYRCSYEGGLAAGGLEMARGEGLKVAKPVILLTGVGEL